MAEIGRTQSDVQFAQIAAGLIRVDPQVGMIANPQGGVRRILRPCSVPCCPELTAGDYDVHTKVLGSRAWRGRVRQLIKRSFWQSLVAVLAGSVQPTATTLP